MPKSTKGISLIFADKKASAIRLKTEPKKKAPKSQNLELFRVCARQLLLHCSTTAHPCAYKLASLKQRAHLSEIIQDSKRDKGKWLRLERGFIGFAER